MHDLIRIATTEFVAFLSTHLPALRPEWWTTHVEEQLTHTQQQRVAINPQSPPIADDELV